MDIHVLEWYRYKDMAGLQQLMGSQPSIFFKWIFTSEKRRKQTSEDLHKFASTQEDHTRRLHKKITHCHIIELQYIVLWVRLLKPLLTIFQLYRGGEFYWWRKPSTFRKSLTKFIT
jgi:hypothetical protein